MRTVNLRESNILHPNPWRNTVNHFSVPDNVSPHGSTARISTTVPIGSIYYIVYVFAGLMRNSAPTTPGLAEVYLTIDGSKTVINTMEISSDIGMMKAHQLTHPFSIGEGKLVQIYTKDESTGGTYNYRLFLGYVLAEQYVI